MIRLGPIVLRLTLFFAGLGIIPGVQAAPKGSKQNETKPKKRRPSLDLNQFGRTKKIDIQMAEKRSAIRDQLKTILKYEKDRRERPALLFRLAENYSEEALAYFERAQELDQSLAKDPSNLSLRRRINKQKRKFRKAEHKWRKDAIKVYKIIAIRYPRYLERDHVLYSLGDALWSLERYQEGLGAYKRLIASYRRSKYVPDAYLRFGEYYFDQGKLEEALMAYKKVARYKKSNLYPYALYKQAWCYYNLHEWMRAKRLFRAVIALANTGASKVQIRTEALNDFTLTYSHQGSAKSAPRIFARLAPKEAKKLLQNLASMYFADGKDKNAVVLYRYLIYQESCSADVPFYQGRIVDAASRIGDKRYVIRQVRDLVNELHKAQQCLANPTEQQKKRLGEADELAEVTLRKLASVWYKEARETKQKRTFEYAQELFGDYLTLFPNSKDAYDMRFAFAELLFHRLARYERAASEYGKIVAADLAYLKEHPSFPKKRKKTKKQASSPGAYFCDAAYKAMQAHREIVKKERRRRRRKRDTKQADRWQKKPIPKSKVSFIASAEIFLDRCPKDEDILDVKYDMAKTYYDHYHLQEAIQRFDEIVRDFPKAELAVYAANLVLDALNEKEEVDKLDTYARKYYSNQSLMKNEQLKNNLEELIPKIAFKRIDEVGQKIGQLQPTLSQRRIYSKVAFRYIKFYRAFPKHDLADEALFNASVKYEQAERLDKVQKARLLLIDKYPQSELVPGTIYSLAENYERLADYSQAAKMYERYALTFKKLKEQGKPVSGRKPKKSQSTSDKEPKTGLPDGNRRDWNEQDAEIALLNAGIYREALHQYKRAIANRIEFTTLFPRSKDAAQVFFSLGLLYERLGKLSKAAEVYQEYYGKYFRANIDQAIAAHMKRAIVLRRMRRPNWEEIEREEKTTTWLYNKYSRRMNTDKLPLSAEAAARAAFFKAEEAYKDYLGYRFSASSSKSERAQQRHLRKQLKEKVNKFKVVERVYKRVALRKQAEWSIASLYKLGRAYEDFAKTLYRAPLPKGLTSQQVDLYKSTLRNMGQPYEDKAVSHYRAAVDKGSELGFYSGFARLALTKLQHYRPDEYPREELGFALELVADQAWRKPLVLAKWDEVRSNPALLDEPPLATKREEVVLVAEPKITPTETPGPQEAQTVDVERQPGADTELPPVADAQAPPEDDSDLSPVADAQDPPEADADLTQVADAQAPPEANAALPQETDAQAPPEADADLSQVADAQAPPEADTETSPVADTEAPTGAGSESPQGTDAESSQLADTEAPPGTDTKLPQATNADSSQEAEEKTPPTASAKDPFFADADSPSIADAEIPAVTQTETPLGSGETSVADATLPPSADTESPPHIDNVIPQRDGDETNQPTHTPTHKIDSAKDPAVADQKAPHTEGSGNGVDDKKTDPDLLDHPVASPDAEDQSLAPSTPESQDSSIKLLGLTMSFPTVEMIKEVVAQPGLQQTFKSLAFFYLCVFIL